jgi:hypothetical protein
LLVDSPFRRLDVGGHPWFYFVAYQKDINKALQELKVREFRAGRYNPVIRFLTFPMGDDSPSPGAKHASIQKALEASREDGTRSILDMDRVDTKPDDFVVVPLSPDRLMELYGTHRPAREAIEADMDFFDDIERGQGIYIVVYKDHLPSEILFAGYSFD